MNIPKFPRDFHYPKNAVPISHEQINEWIKECINEIEKDEEAEYHFTESGDTRVTVYRLHEDDGKYEIIVSKSQYDYIIFD